MIYIEKSTIDMHGEYYTDLFLRKIKMLLNCRTYDSIYAIYCTFSIMPNQSCIEPYHFSAHTN